MKFVYYKDVVGEWRWNLVSSNGNIIADSGQGYKSKQSCLEGISLVQSEANDATVIAARILNE